MLSRVADSLYWMSRYLERAEHTARLIEVQLDLMLDQPPNRLGRSWARLQASLTPAPSGPGGDDPSGRARAIAFGLLNRATFAGCMAAARENVRAIVSCTAAARENARQVRDLISSDMWESLNRLYLETRKGISDEAFEAAPQAFFRRVVDATTAFQGVTDGTICHDEGWHFIQLGRSIERAAATAAILDVHFGDDAVRAAEAHRHDRELDWMGVLRGCSAVEPFRKVHASELRPERVIEFLLLEPDFPRSARFAVDVVNEALDAISAASGRKNERADRLAGRLRSALRFAQIDELLASGLRRFLSDVQGQCAAIQGAIHETYVDYPIESELDP